MSGKNIADVTNAARKSTDAAQMDATERGQGAAVPTAACDASAAVPIARTVKAMPMKIATAGMESAATSMPPATGVATTTAAVRMNRSSDRRDAKQRECGSMIVLIHK